jgi:hypothetical protein
MRFPFRRRPAMTEITREQLFAYLDDSLGEAETARIEQALRADPALRDRLRVVLQERDRGEHSLGAIWRRERLSCPTREQLGSYLLQALDDDFQKYLDFHLKTVACPVCLANLADLQALREEPPAKAQQRRRKFFDSSAGYLHVARDRRR